MRLVFAILFLIALILTNYVITRIFFDLNMGLLEFAFDGPGSFAIYFYILSVEFFMFILRQVNLLLGHNKLSELLRGKFYTPHEEERIFMFLDLQSSTQLAEKLGHIKYSMMIQDCFNDLGVVVENEAEIYQYVGDEIVVSWKMKDGLANANCINCFFEIQKALKSKAAYYEESYDGILPEFKAGLHYGNVMAGEIGVVKRDIVFSGDVLNTAARIQQKCNELSVNILFSDYLLNKLNFKSVSFNPQKIEQSDHF